jgi:hypothetical protein
MAYDGDFVVAVLGFGCGLKSCVLMEDGYEKNETALAAEFADDGTCERP